MNRGDATIVRRAKMLWFKVCLGGAEVVACVDSYVMVLLF